MPLRAEKVWLTHITYTHHYWEHMCDQVLYCDLHFISRAELSDSEPDVDHANLALMAYRSIFGKEPPARSSANLPGISNFDFGSLGLFLLIAILAIPTGGMSILVGFLSLLALGLASALLSDLEFRRYRSGKAIQISKDDQSVVDGILGLDIANLGATSQPLIGQLEEQTGQDRERCRKNIEE